MRLEAAALSVSLDGHTVVDAVEMSMRTGELVALVGPNGAGKSTLVRALSGVLAPAAGEVRLEGAELRAIEPAARARSIAYLPQDAMVHWPVTVERLVALGRLPHLDAFHRPGERDRAAILGAMEATGIAAFARRPAARLSAGERARVLLARALATEAPFLLADEPVAALDPYHQLQVMELLAAQAAEGRGVLVVLHELTLAARFCSRILLMAEGRLLADGPADSVLSDRLLAGAYGIRVARSEGWLVPTERIPRQDD